MNREFECYMRLKHGDRYDLTRDTDGLYCREVLSACLKSGVTAREKTNESGKLCQISFSEDHSD